MVYKLFYTAYVALHSNKNPAINTSSFYLAYDA